MVDMSLDRLTFFNGTKGTGVQVLYGRGANGLLFDFGIPHRGLIDAFNVATFDPIKLNPSRGVRQLLLGRMAPPIKELYDETQMDAQLVKRVEQLWGSADIPRYERLSVYINHAHQDHMAILPYARKDLPVYMSSDTFSLYRGIVASGEYGDTQAELIQLPNLTEVDLGDFRFQILDMDHDAPGAAALLIESSDYTIAYTGDWTRNGFHPERIDRFIELCCSRPKPIDVLITEATHPKPGPVPLTEPEVVAKYVEILKQSDGMVYLQALPRNVERMAEFIYEAVRSGRSVVMDYSLALLWKETIIQGLKALKGHPVMEMSGMISVVDATAPAGAELPFRAISLEEMAVRKRDIVYILTYPNLPLAIELELLHEEFGTSQYIVANTPMKPDQLVYLEKYTAELNMNLHKIGTSGHASAHAITDLITRIAPKAVIPMHGGNPRLLDTGGIRAYYPEKGDSILVRDLICCV
jgi:hypothetical protein